MMRRTRGVRALLAVLLAGAGLAAAAGSGAEAAPGTTHVPAATGATLNGSGSSWAEPAIDQWSRDVRPQGIVINYAPNGSAQGRSDFTGDLVDFAGSDIAFLTGQDKIAGGTVETSKYGYSYLPITAGGTAFMYHLTVGGRQVTNLRLSGQTIADIFTGKVTNWNDAEITRDYGAQLPSEPITPVIRSDGSGATAQFTGWMNNQFQNEWSAFCKQYGNVSANPCGETEFYPSFGKAKAQGSSTAVANYITSSFGNGAIGYDEYAYALASHYPVVKVENKAGYYVLPTAQNDAVALQSAVINMDQTSVNYLTEDLTGVYNSTDPRTYPISSYSYLIVPRTASGKEIPPTWSAAKGATMSNFANYFLCAGQKEVANLGYSPLPINLVQGGFNQVKAMPSSISTPASSNLAACDNPTFINGKNVLLSTAPFPTKCDKVGSPLVGCGATQGGAPSSYVGNKSSGGTTPATSGAGTGNGGAGAGTSNATGTGTGNGGGKTGAGTANGAGTTNGGTKTSGTGTHVDPVTGNVVANTGTAGTDGTSDGTTNVAADGVPAQAVLVSSGGTSRWFPAVVAALAILAAVAAPPALTVWGRRRKRS